ncbi:hypothetical protein RJ639_024496 [Escallonia herrerae]|uniref:Cyanobacterial aminoacyl-tRNA synthetase CAAD domain-containing protein n=1 Tax=Escallonia herrerae TaxID=1293975 RepID=A0AA89AD20_9ASTE|nr:hypothetical protein RJ639_024496 [Escallonia herrerae]
MWCVELQSFTGLTQYIKPQSSPDTRQSKFLFLALSAKSLFEFEAVRNPSNRPKSNFSSANHMASIITTKLPLPPLFVSERRPFSTPPQQSSFSAIGEGKGRVAVVAKATGESTESSTSLSIVKSVQSVAIDKLPLIPSALEFIGILFSSWFIYRYLLFKPDREELGQTINKSIADILGQ